MAGQIKKYIVILISLKERARKTIKRCRDNFSALLSYYEDWIESQNKVLKIWLRIFLKKSSNFVQKTQPKNNYL